MCHELELIVACRACRSVEGLQEKMAGLAKELGVPPGMGLPGM